MGENVKRQANAIKRKRRVSWVYERILLAQIKDGIKRLKKKGESEFLAIRLKCGSAYPCSFKRSVNWAEFSIHSILIKWK